MVSPTKISKREGGAAKLRFRGAEPPYRGSPQANTAPASFLRFTKLPIELRFTIYDHTSLDPRTVYFGHDYPASDTDPKKENSRDAPSTAKVEPHESEEIGKNNESHKVKSTHSRGHNALEKTHAFGDKLPWALLAVSREARDYAQKRYTLAFKNELSQSNGGVYIDFERDKLFFKSVLSLEALCGSGTPYTNLGDSNATDLQLNCLDKIKVLSVDGWLSEQHAKFILRFRNLDALYLWESGVIDDLRMQKKDHLSKELKKLVYKGNTSKDEGGEGAPNIEKG